MKKIIAMLMALVMMMSLAACGPKEETVEFSRGVVEGNVYTSEFGGITFTAPEGFRYYSDDEIAAVNGISEELLDVETLDTVVYDMYCINEATGSTINVNFENLGALYGALLDEKDYIDMSLETLETSFEGTGIGINSMETGTVEISGQEFNSVDLTIDFGGIVIYETLFVKEISGNMMNCTVAALDEPELENILAGFQVA